MSKSRITQLKCCKCGWKWTPRIADVRKCPNPKCQSIRWDEPDEPEIEETYNDEESDE